MTGKDLVKLSVDLSTGAITQQLIREKYGDSVLTTVLGLGTAGLVGVATDAILDIIDDNTGIVSDLGGVVDDVFSIFD